MVRSRRRQKMNGIFKIYFLWTPSLSARARNQKNTMRTRPLSVNTFTNSLAANVDTVPPVRL